VVGVGTSVTSQVPGPAGKLATQVLQSVGSTVDHILPLPGPGSAAPAKSGAGRVGLP
jgi:hypothetical protein